MKPNKFISDFEAYILSYKDSVPFDALNNLHDISEEKKDVVCDRVSKYLINGKYTEATSLYSFGKFDYKWNILKLRKAFESYNNLRVGNSRFFALSVAYVLTESCINFKNIPVIEIIESKGHCFVVIGRIEENTVSTNLSSKILGEGLILNNYYFWRDDCILIDPWCLAMGYDGHIFYTKRDLVNNIYPYRLKLQEKLRLVMSTQF